MPRLFALIFLLLAAPAWAQDSWAQDSWAQDTTTPAKLVRLPEVFALTTAKEGDWGDVDDYISEALQEVEELANKRGFKLTTTEVVIYELFGLKNFRARIGYLMDTEGKVKPHRPAQRFERRQLKGPAFMASGDGGGHGARRIEFRPTLGLARCRIATDRPVEKPRVAAPAPVIADAVGDVEFF